MGQWFAGMFRGRRTAPAPSEGVPHTPAEVERAQREDAAGRAQREGVAEQKRRDEERQRAVDRLARAYNAGARWGSGAMPNRLGGRDPFQEFNEGVKQGGRQP